jgi:hypothetical protein
MADQDQKILNEMQVTFSRHDPELGADVYEMENVVHCAVRAVASEPPITQDIETDHANADTKADVLVEDGVVRQKWRFLSAVKAWPHSSYWEPQLVDYTNNGGEALKHGIPLINNDRPDLRWDHSDSARDVAGNIQDAEWEDTSDIEAGINGYVVVDEAFDSKAAIGIKKGIIRSGSIGIRAEFVRSHPDMKLEQFVANQGKIVDDEEVRWIATRITKVGHMAILPTGEGADPNAGPRTTPAPVPVSNQTVTHKVEPQGETKPQLKKYKGGFKMADGMLHLGEVANLLKVDFSIDEATVMPEQLREITDNLLKRITGLLDNHKALLAYQSKLKALESYVIYEDEQGLKSADILDRLPEKLEYAKHGEAFLLSQRGEAVGWFDKAKVVADADMSENDKRIRGRISNSQDLGFVQEQLTLYKEMAEGRFGPLRSAESAPIEEKTEKPIINNEAMDDMKALFGGKK